MGEIYDEILEKLDNFRAKYEQTLITAQISKNTSNLDKKGL